LIVNWKHGQAVACVALVVWSAVTPAAIQMAAAQQVSSNAAPVSPTLPTAPNPTQPLFLRPTPQDYGKGHSGLPNPFAWYQRTNYPEPRLSNTARLNDLLRDGKIYLSLSDAVMLALENNFDIAIARINLDIADADLLRARAGASLRGVSTGIVANTIGGSSSTITGGGGPGGTTNAVGGSGTGSGGLVLSTNGGGPVPENLDPTLTSAVEYQSQTQAQATPLFSGGLPSIYTNNGTFNFGYTQGFLSGTQVQVAFNNQRMSTN
jgi:outer membrane protein